MNKMKVVNVFVSDGSDIPEEADKFMEFWQEQIDLIPKEHRDTAEITINAIEQYGYPDLDVRVLYSRPETINETIDRERKEEAIVNAQQYKDIAMLRKLKEKYGDV